MGWHSLCGLQASRDTHGAGRRDLWDPARRVAMVSICRGRVGAAGEWDLLLAEGGLAEGGQSLQLGESWGHPAEEEVRGLDEAGDRRHRGKGQVTCISKGDPRDCALALDLGCVCGRTSELPETTLVRLATNPPSVGFKWLLGLSCHSAFPLCFMFLTSCALLLW